MAVSRETIRSTDFASIYANDIHIQASPWDFRLVLGEITDTPSDGSPVLKIRERGEVRVSPQLAKQLVLILIEQLKTYEQQFGDIPSPAR